MAKRLAGLILVSTSLFGRVGYNHPELDWQTFETDHFRIHFTDETERSAREGAFVAESIYGPIIRLYNYSPPEKTHIIFLDTDDYSNGITYFYENKIEIWVSPLDLELRGSHRWLQNVITHEFVHIVSIQKAMKFPRRVPAGYLQWIGYEEEKREDVLYGYPNTLVSYPVPGSVVPPWLAEGIAQYMYRGATYDFWDTHRDMILRDQVIHGELLTLPEMSTFGKSGIGNESVYNSGFALVRYIVFKYGEQALVELVSRLSSPLVVSVDSAIRSVLGISSRQLYGDFRATLEERYRLLTERIDAREVKGSTIIQEGTANLHPVWAPDEKRFAYLSNAGNDFFSQTDLYVYSFDSGESRRIARGVVSAPAWNSDGSMIYYTRKSRPDRRGSRWYDIYGHSFRDEKEHRLTQGARAFSPVVFPGDSTLVYLASNGGTQNIFMIDLKSKQSEQITDFEPGTQLFSLDYDSTRGWLMFDYVKNHFRDTGTLTPGDTTFSHLIATEEWDERDVTPAPDGGIVYSNDKNGVFNLYVLDSSAEKQGYITNVQGGAFTPDVSRTGRILFSLYENGGYRIALLDSVSILDPKSVGYGPNYFLRFENLPGSLMSGDTSTATHHEDTFSPMFVFPRLMVDYGTVKPGLYFFANEILGKLNLFGGGSVNPLGDVDLFLMYEFRKFYPTLHTEIFYLTRNARETITENVYNPQYDIWFRLFQWDVGVKVPILGLHELDLFGSYQHFRESLKERVPSQAHLAKIALDYYIGQHLGMSWMTDIHRETVDYAINPGNGFQGQLELRHERDRFFRGFRVNEDYSVLEEVYDTYRFTRLTGRGRFHFTLPFTKRLTSTLEAQVGWMTDTEVDSFFNFFAGGMPGLKGYPFYGVEGNRLLVMSVTVRAPILWDRHVLLGPFVLRRVVAGVIGQAGDAWNGGLEEPALRRSVGFQIRFGGYSFYNYPTGIAVEFHRGLDKFSVMDRQYGGGLRTYFTFLLGF
ncbi:MAG: hypothetical protein ACE5HZ_04580 [Fidelibacterota bacterium]